jgi:hypothetical protein
MRASGPSAEHLRMLLDRSIEMSERGMLRRMSTTYRSIIVNAQALNGRASLVILILPSGRRGPRLHSFRRILDAIFFLLPTTCAPTTRGATSPQQV